MPNKSIEAGCVRVTQIRGKAQGMGRLFRAILFMGLAACVSAQAQVRYYYDEDRSKAEQLAALVSQLTGGKVLLARLKLDAKLGTLEVWFGTSSSTH